MFIKIMFVYLFIFFKSLLNIILNNIGLYYLNNIDVEILYKSHDYLIVNKPEDVFINNHNKKVSVLSICHYIIK